MDEFTSPFSVYQRPCFEVQAKDGNRWQGVYRSHTIAGAESFARPLVESGPVRIMDRQGWRTWGVT